MIHHHVGQGLKRTRSFEDVGSEWVYPEGAAPAQTLPRDVILGKIIPLLTFMDCIAMSGGCRKWRAMIEPSHLLSKIIFGKKQWEEIPGVTNVSDEPVLTKNQIIRLIARFAGVCPFFNEPDLCSAHIFQADDTIKRFWQTFRVIFIPEKINGKDVDLNLIGQVFSFEKTVNNDGTGYSYIVGDQNSDFRTKKAGRSYYLIASVSLVPRSRKTCHQDKEKLLSTQGFRVPNPLEAAIMTFVLNIGPSKEGRGYFFPGMTCYTATDTTLGHYRICVGNASDRGIQVNDNSAIYDDFSFVGVVAVAEP